MTTTLHHPKSTRAQRRRAQRKRNARKSRRGWIPMASVVAVIVVAGLVAVMVTAGSGDTSGETAAVSISGSALPAMSTPDSAAGMRAPTVSGVSFSKAPVSVPTAGKPTVVVFLAHWCPHCRKDVPVIQSWLNQNGLPAGVDLVTVSTWVDKNKPNYPPSAWLSETGWRAPVLVDDAKGSMAAAYGLRGTPMWVFVGADGLVKFRMEGELTGPQFGVAVNRLLGA